MPTSVRSVPGPVGQDEFRQPLVGVCWAGHCQLPQGLPQNRHNGVVQVLHTDKS